MFVLKRLDEKPENYDFFPSHNFLCNYDRHNTAEMATVLGAKTISGDDIRRLGDSDIYVQISFTGLTGSKAKKEFTEYVDTLVELIEEGLPSMSSPYRSFFRYFLDDYRTNGLGDKKSA